MNARIRDCDGLEFLTALPVYSHLAKWSSAEVYGSHSRTIKVGGWPVDQGYIDLNVEITAKLAVANNAPRRGAWLQCQHHALIYIEGDAASSGRVCFHTPERRVQ